MHVVVILHFDCSYHGLFASTVKSTHWLATGYIIDQTWKDPSLEKSMSSETPLRTTTLPSQNACWNYALEAIINIVIIIIPVSR